MLNQEKQLQYWRDRAAAAEEKLRADQRTTAGLKAFVKRNHPDILNQYSYFAGSPGRRQRNG